MRQSLQVHFVLLHKAEKSVGPDQFARFTFTKLIHFRRRACANKIKYLLINLEYYKDLKTNAKNPIKIFDVLRELSAQVYCLT
jgi:hypothetical protein